MTAIYRLAESVMQRLADTEKSDAILKARLATLEERLLELEKRLNILCGQILVNPTRETPH